MKYSMDEFKTYVLRGINEFLPAIFRGHIPFELTWKEYHDPYSDIWYA